MTPPTIAPPAATAPPAGARRLTRDDLVALGQAGRPWEFLPVAEAALRLAPEDAGLLLLAAANFAKVGLRTAAREKLAAIPPALRGDPAVVQLASVLERLPDDRIAPEARIARARAGAEVVRAKAPREDAAALDAALRAWEERVGEEEWFLAADGNIARRSGGAWTRLGDLAGLARSGRIPEGDAPVTVEGLDPPWLVLRLAEGMPPRGDGYWRRLRIVEPDLRALCDGLAAADLRGVLSQARVDLFIGPGAAERLAADLDARMATQITGPALALPGCVRAPVAPGVIEAANTRQVGRLERLTAEVARVYRGRDRAWWARRYAEAAAGGEPLRVLIPAPRFSTFVRHAAADFAAALRDLGCEAEVLTEPDDSSLLSSVGYLEAIARLRPDLVVLINYTRANLARVIPAEVPVVCWIQDALVHLFREEVGAAQGELDFVIGHLHEDLFNHFKYPRQRTLASPVVVSEAKFHAGPVDPELAKRLACEIAYAGNQSEPPEALRDRLMRESAASRASVRAIGAIFERLPAVLDAAMDGPVQGRLLEVVREEVARAGGGGGGGVDPKVVSHAMNMWCRPMADRLLRHQTLRWAAEIAEERGWRLRIFGRGWENHPSLARYAGGPLEHGEALRASYHAAAAHLHASISGCLHQRVLECALSGGLPLCRLMREDVGVVESFVFAALVERGRPFASWIADRSVSYWTSDHPEAMAAAGLMQRLGLVAPAYWTAPRMWVEDPHQCGGGGGAPVMREAAWLLGDMAETGFWSKQTLAAAVARAVERPAWREHVSAGIARRARAGLTHVALARRMIDLIRARLGNEGAESAAATTR